MLIIIYLPPFPKSHKSSDSKPVDDIVGSVIY